MDDFSDVPLRRDTSGPLPPPEENRIPRATWIIAAVFAIAVAGAVFVVFFRGGPAGVATPKTPSAAAPVAARPPLGAPAESIALPPLDQSDELVRTLVERLSRHPLVSAFLGMHDLVRTFAVEVLNVADGASPAPNLAAVLRPKTPFATIQRSGVEYIDPESYERYTPLADAIHSIDAADAARLYTTLKPLLDAAYQDLGFPNRHFDDLVRRVIVVLLQTPAVDTPVAVERQGAVYRFADGRLEQLSGSQKQLLRMGPRNAATVKDKVRDIAVALGMRADTLPPR